jgi:hypothetical protein
MFIENRYLHRTRRKNKSTKVNREEMAFVFYDENSRGSDPGAPASVEVAPYVVGIYMPRKRQRPLETVDAPNTIGGRSSVVVDVAVVVVVLVGVAVVDAFIEENGVVLLL